MIDIDRWRARFGWFDAFMRFNERFGMIGGGPLASSIGLSAFLSLFPLLLVAIAVIGFLSSGDQSFTANLVADLGLEGRAAEVVTDAVRTAEGSRRAASIIGVLGFLWSGVGLVGSLQNAFNSAWQTSGRGLLDKAVSLAWLLGAGALLLTSAALGAALQVVPGPVVVLTVILGLVLNTALFVWAYTFLGNQPVPWRANLPGAVLVAIGFEVLKVVGSVYVPRAVSSSSALYGSIGVVFAVLAWLLIYARLIVYGAVLNVMRWEAEQGTVTVAIEVPRMEGETPLFADRGGAAQDPPDADEDDQPGST